MCGGVGSGKTTYAQQLEREGYDRLSIDEEIWARHGKYGIDYSPEQYSDYQIEAEATLRLLLGDLIREGRDVVVDFSFLQRARRDEYKHIIEQAGGTWKLIYLRVKPEVLRERLAKRSQRFDANAAFPITEEIQARYLHGFEPPSGEGEEIIDDELTKYGSKLEQE